MIENMVKILNELLEADPDATNKFFNLGVTVNKQVCDHPTIQVRCSPNENETPNISEGTLRPLGLINGLIQEDNQIIVMIMDMPSEKTITKFVIGTLNNGKVSLHG